MCGLFGMVRALHADVQRATQLLLRLGLSAEERGIDGAGLALGLPGAAAAVHGAAVRRRDVRVGRWRIVKSPGRFRDLAVSGGVGDDLALASLVLGHTRWATQGRAGLLVNTSPLVVGDLVGTHNGDVDAVALQRRLRLGAVVGETDTAMLLAAIERAGQDPVVMLDVLEAVVGRAALAWAPLTGDRQLWLARGGLSPLAVARDEQANLFWASNPLWLRRAAAAVGATLTTPPVMFPTGLLVRVVRERGVPTLAGWWSYKPKVRASDVRQGGVWRGFTAADRTADQQRLRHRIRPARAAGAFAHLDATRRLDLRAG